MTAPRTFEWFLIGNYQATGFPNDHGFRIGILSVKIDSASDLVAWVRENFPDLYFRSHEEGVDGACHLETIWGIYLAWAKGES